MPCSIAPVPLVQPSTSVLSVSVCVMEMCCTGCAVAFLSVVGLATGLVLMLLMPGAGAGALCCALAATGANAAGAKAAAPVAFSQLKTAEGSF